MYKWLLILGIVGHFASQQTSRVLDNFVYGPVPPQPGDIKLLQGKIVLRINIENRNDLSATVVRFVGQLSTQQGPVAELNNRTEWSIPAQGNTIITLNVQLDDDKFYNALSEAITDPDARKIYISGHLVLANGVTLPIYNYWQL